MALFGKKQAEKPKKDQPIAGKLEAFIPVKGYETGIDALMRLVEKQKSILVKDASSQLGMSEQGIEEISRVLEEQGVLRYEYSTLKAPKLVMGSPINYGKPEQKMSGKKVDEYTYSADFVPVRITITEDEEKQGFYNLSVPEFGVYTKEFLKQVKSEIAEKISIDVEDFTDPEKRIRLKGNFLETVKNELNHYFKDGKELEVMAGLMLEEMYGLGKLELIMEDAWLEEVAINSSKVPVTVYHRKFGWLKTNIPLQNEEEILNYAAQIARKVGREITTLNPILDAHLAGGDRVNATVFPVSANGNTITIRKFSRNPWTIVDFIGKQNAMNAEIASWLWLGIQYEMNMIIAGSTASGKTSTLNALVSLIPSKQRIISIEDVREIILPEYMNWNWIPMVTRNPNPEGAGGISMLDLLQSSLRMRPDRIVLGEMRKRQEAEVLFEAMHTGHSVYSTLHADSGRQVIRRLTEPPIEIPKLEVEAIDLILVQFRDRRTNARKTFEVSEIESEGEGELNAKSLYRYSARANTWEKTHDPSGIIQKLNAHTGMTQKEVYDEIASRTSILNWMVKNDWHEINQVGNVMKLFYSSEDELMKAVQKNTAPKELFGK